MSNDNPQVMSDRNRVKHVLVDEQPLTQQEIANAVGWSETKVSVLLTEMEEDGEVFRLRYGREKYVSLHPFIH
jgi:predicted transcriptional regulator